ncbi:MAG: type II and III secretion system protein family protein [Hyphomicrobiales bacterium]|nr:MAG: type II and III secretion system protein family protein [Hyphomicrobiales bacterium]
MTMREDKMDNRPKMRRPQAGRWRAALLAVAATLLLGGPAAAAQAGYLRIPHKALGAMQSLSLEVNKSILVDLPTNVGEVIASQPAVATVVMRSKTRAIVQGVSGGDTNIFFLDAAGNSIAVLDLKIYQPRSDVGNALEAAIARNIPGSQIRVESALLADDNNRVVLTGTALSQDDLNKATQMAIQFAGKPENVANIATVNGNQQVMLQVVIAEVNRSVVKQFGLDLNVSSGGVITGLVNNPSDVLGGASGISTGQGTITAGGTIGSTTISATLKALAQQNALRTLAEPNLTAISGNEAAFLVGGQRAIITRDENGNPITTYKDYGVRLTFTPTVKSNGRIGLAVNTEVSSPVGTTDFNTRSAKTTVEIPAGATLAIGGLLQNEIRQQISQMPGLGDIPIFGALFRSRDFIKSQTELMVLVTPVMAQYGTPELPTDRMAMSGDAEAIFLGRMEALYGVGSDGMRGTYNGSVGFVLD